MSSKLINCSDCDKEISRNAKTCPGCGAKNKKRPGSPIIKTFMILIFLIWIAGMFGKDPRSSVNQSSLSTPVDDSVNICERAVQAKLQFPSSFDPSFATGASKVLKDGTTAVQFDFEAKNGIGNVIPQTGSCILKNGVAVIAFATNR